MTKEVSIAETINDKLVQFFQNNLDEQQKKELLKILGKNPDDFIDFNITHEHVANITAEQLIEIELLVRKAVKKSDIKLEFALLRNEVLAQSKFKNLEKPVDITDIPRETLTTQASLTQSMAQTNEQHSWPIPGAPKLDEDTKACIEYYLLNPVPNQEEFLQKVSTTYPRQLAKYLQEAKLDVIAIIAGRNDNSDLTEKILTRAKSHTNWWSRLKSWFSDEATTDLEKGKAIIELIKTKQQHPQDMPPVMAKDKIDDQNIAKIPEITAAHHPDPKTILEAGKVAKELNKPTEHVAGDLAPQPKSSQKDGHNQGSSPPHL